MIHDPRQGQLVRLNVPENGKLHRARATVGEVTPWGAVVWCEAAATGVFRALREEMDPVDEEQQSDAEEQAASMNGHRSKEVPAHRPVSKAFRQPARHTVPETMSASGEICSNCGGINLVRRGACMTCEDCGTSGGCS